MEINSSSLAITPHPERLNDIIVDAIQDIKGSDIVTLDLREIDDAPTDYFIICEGESNTQIKAISENVSKRVKNEMMIWPDHVEGVRSSRWILVDYFTTVVHIFSRETRQFYDLEDLWSDAKVTTSKDDKAYNNTIKPNS